MSCQNDDNACSSSDQAACCSKQIHVASAIDWKEEEDLVMQATSKFISDVFPLLMRIGASFSASSQIYSFPGSGKLQTEEGLRRWMLHNGIPNLSHLDLPDQRLLSAWVRYTNVKRSDLCLEIDNQMLERSVASIFQTQFGIFDQNFLRNYRPPIWKFGISNLRESTTFPIDMLPKMKRLSKEDRSTLRLWAVRGGYPLPRYSGIHVPVSKNETTTRIGGRACQSQKECTEDSFKLCILPTHVEIWPVLKALGWTHHPKAPYQLHCVCENDIHSIEDILGFMATRGIPNVSRLDVVDKRMLLEMIRCRHVDFDQVRNAENSFCGLDPSVFQEPLGGAELRSFLQSLGFKYITKSRMFQLSTRHGRGKKHAPMSLKEVQNMLCIYGFSKCNRVASSCAFSKRRKLRCQIWASMAETPLPDFKESRKRRTGARSLASYGTITARDDGVKQQQPDHSFEKCHYIEEEGKNTTGATKKRVRDVSSKRTLLKSEEPNPSIVHSSPSPEQRLQQMCLYNECLRVRSYIEFSRNSYAKKRTELLRLWQASLNMAETVEWSWPRPEIVYDDELPDTFEVLPPKIFCDMTIEDSLVFRDNLNKYLQEEQTRLAVVRKEKTRVLAEARELATMYRLKRKSSDDLTAVEVKIEMEG